jgi:hypothetical protein
MNTPLATPQPAMPVAPTGPTVTSNLQGDPKSVMALLSRIQDPAERNAAMGAYAKQGEQQAPVAPQAPDQSEQLKARGQEMLEKIQRAGPYFQTTPAGKAMAAQALQLINAGRQLTPAPVKESDAWGEPYEQGGVTLQRNEKNGQIRQVIGRAPREPSTESERWSEPYEINGAMVQRNEKTGQVRTAVTREPSTSAGGEKDINGQIERFSARLQTAKVAPLLESARVANDLLNNYADKDIPGLGLGVGSAMVPNAFRSTEANNVRSALKAVTNDLLSMYSGLAVTLPESERRELEQMQRGDFSVKDFKNAWPRVIGRMNAVLGNLKAGLAPEAVSTYQSRAGALNLDPLTPAFGAAPTGGWSIKKK